MGLFSSNHHHRTESVPYEKSVTINEHKAPTDESVKLLNEFESRARKNIIHKVKIDENYLKAIAVYYKDDMVEFRVHFYVKFSLNGTEVVVEDYLDNFEWRSDLSKEYGGFGNRHIFELVFKKLSDMIASELMGQFPDFKKLLQNNRHL